VGGRLSPPSFFDIVGFYLSFLILSPCMPGHAGRGALTGNPFSSFFQGEPAVFGSVDTYPVNLRKMQDGSGYSNKMSIHIGCIVGTTSGKSVDFCVFRVVSSLFGCPIVDFWS
jgi:hypothetical protein